MIVKMDLQVCGVLIGLDCFWIKINDLRREYVVEGRGVQVHF